MTDEAVVKLFDTVGPRFGDRNGGYTRIIRTAWNKGDGADKAFLELLGSEKVLDEKREKRAEARAKKAAEAKKAMEEAEAQAAQDGGVEPAKEERKTRKISSELLIRSRQSLWARLAPCPSFCLQKCLRDCTCTLVIPAGNLVPTTPIPDLNDGLHQDPDRHCGRRCQCCLVGVFVGYFGG